MRGKTAALWVQYFKLVSIVKKYIEAERSRNWKLHPIDCEAAMMVAMALFLFIELPHQDREQDVDSTECLVYTASDNPTYGFMRFVGEYYHSRCVR